MWKKIETKIGKVVEMQDMKKDRMDHLTMANTMNVESSTMMHSQTDALVQIKLEMCESATDG